MAGRRDKTARRHREAEKRELLRRQSQFDIVSLLPVEHSTDDDDDDDDDAA